MEGVVRRLFVHGGALARDKKERSTFYEKNLAFMGVAGDFRQVTKEPVLGEQIRPDFVCWLATGRFQAQRWQNFVCYLAGSSEVGQVVTSPHHLQTLLSAPSGSFVLQQN